jgi:hypothetical protein
LDGSTARHRRVPWRLYYIGILFALLGAIAPRAAYAHAGNPSFRSNLESLSPAIPGLRAEVLNYDDRLLLTNRSGRTVIVRGYDGEQYIRIRGDGTVEVNKRSPSYYLNEDRFAKVDVPPQASAGAPPDWSTVSKDGRYEWHDHRIHYMSKGIPSQVEDKGKRTKNINWSVTIDVGAVDLLAGGVEHAHGTEAALDRLVEAEHDEVRLVFDRRAPRGRGVLEYRVSERRRREREQTKHERAPKARESSDGTQLHASLVRGFDAGCSLRRRLRTISTNATAANRRAANAITAPLGIPPDDGCQKSSPARRPRSPPTSIGTRQLKIFVRLPLSSTWDGMPFDM